jgi:antitoxin MazE
MRITLTKHGDSLALVIDQSILNALHIDENTPLDIATDGESLLVVPVRDANRQERFNQALISSNDRLNKSLKRLAE